MTCRHIESRFVAELARLFNTFEKVEGLQQLILLVMSLFGFVFLVISVHKTISITVLFVLFALK
jgi:hypothetical protein